MTKIVNFTLDIELESNQDIFDDVMWFVHNLEHSTSATVVRVREIVCKKLKGDVCQE